MAPLKSARLCFLMVLIFTSISANAFSWNAFGGRKDLPPEPKARPGVWITEKPDYRILFSLSDEKEIRNGGSAWRELYFKFSSRGNDPRSYFGDSGWAEVQFQDKKGFVLGSAQFPYDDYKTEYYGSVWIEEKKVKQLAQAEIRALKNPPPVPPEPVESPVPAVSAEESTEEAVQEISAVPEPVAAISADAEGSVSAVPGVSAFAVEPSASVAPTPSPTPVPVKFPEPDAEAKEWKFKFTLTYSGVVPNRAALKAAYPDYVPQKLGEMRPPVAAPTPASEPVEALQRDGVTNKQVDDQLTKLEQQPATVIPPSPDKLPDSKSEPKEKTE